MVQSSPPPGNEWEKKRRPELLQLLQEEMYGRMPKGEIGQAFHVTDIDKNFADGLATHKTVEMTLKRNGL